MKICHVITRMIVGGAQENTLFTLRGHLEHGHETILVTGPTDGPEGKLLEHDSPPGLQVVQIPSLIRELNPAADLRAYRELLAYFRETQFDVVHTHSSKAGVLGRMAARKAGVPVVVHTVHGQAFHRFQPWWKNKLYIAAERHAARYCDRIYAVAQAMIEQCVAAGVAPAEKYQVVYSGMELGPYLNASRDPHLAAELGIPDDAVVVGKIARLFELKGYEYLIAAAPQIVAACPKVRFLIVGDGALRESLEQQVAELGLTEHFIFTGLVPPSTIPRYTGLMDLLVHLSLREGLPRTVVQGLASGIPAIGFPLDGTPEVIRNDQTGYLCDTGNTDQVAEAVIRLVNDQALRQKLGAAGREFVRERWDWETMVTTLEAEFERLLAQKQAVGQAQG